MNLASWISLLLPLQAFETPDCFITFLQWDSQHEFVLKQIKDPRPDEQFLLVLDTLGCYMAEIAQIPMNHVQIVPVGTPYTLENPATIHSKALGRSVDTLGPYQDIDIQQRIRKEYHHCWRFLGPIPPGKIGLSYTAIENMSKHKDLGKIAALDTFIGNADRSLSNLFYDEITDSFTGIDLAAAFSSELGKEAYEQIAQWDKDWHYFEEYGKKLKNLVELFPPENQKALLRAVAQEAGFYEGSILWNSDIADRLALHDQVIESNYLWCQKIVQILSERCLSSF